MSDTTNKPLFYTVREAAKILRVDANTIYRAIRENAFPAVRVRTRYVVPAKAIEAMASGATETGTETGGVLDLAAMVQQRRTERELAQRWR